MNRIKKYKDFLLENTKEQQVEQDTKDIQTDQKNINDLTEPLKKEGEFFTGKGSTFLNSLILQNKKGGLKSNHSGGKNIFTIIPSQKDIDLLRKNGVNNINKPIIEGYKTAESIKESKYSFVTSEEKLNESDSTVVPLYSPDEFGNPNATKQQLIDRIMDSIYDPQNSSPFIIWGAPGVGKTALVNDVADGYFTNNESKRVIYIDVPLLLEEDLRLPSIKKTKTETGKDIEIMELLPIETLPLIPDYMKKDENKTDINGPDGKGGIIFLDEIGRAKPGVQTAMLSFIENKRLGSHVLGSKWTIICAANRKCDYEDQLQNKFNFDYIFGNRFEHLNYAMTIDEWLGWASKVNYKITEGENKGKIVPLFDPEFVSFLSLYPKYYHRLDLEEQDEALGGIAPWPSPRSWTDAFTEIRTYEADGEEITKREEEQILHGFVGRQAASAYATYKGLIKKVDLDSVKKVFTDWKNAPLFNDDSIKIDERLALIGAAIMAQTGKRRSDFTKENFENFANWLIENDDPPLIMSAISLFKKSFYSTNTKEDIRYHRHYGETFIPMITDEFPTIFSGDPWASLYIKASQYGLAEDIKDKTIRIRPSKLQ